MVSATLKNRTAIVWILISWLGGGIASDLRADERLLSEQKPNIIVIMADDLGYGDLSCYGATEIQTPNIDRLAAQGLRFTSGYSSASTCTPTRYSLMTGTYAFRTRGTGVAPPNAPAIITPGTPTLASLLKQAGYRTAVIGKWHLGLGPSAAAGRAPSDSAGDQNGAPKPGPDWNGELKPGPLEIGFDYGFILPTTNDRVPQVLVQDHRVFNLDPNDPLWVGDRAPSESHPTGKSHRASLKMDWSYGHADTIHNGISRIGFYTGGHSARFRDEDLTDTWVNRSVEFMEASQQQPFFLLLASHAIHVPRISHERFQGKSKMGYRGDMILELDWSVGQILEHVQRLGLTEKTLIVLCSDNGPVMDDGYADQALEKRGNHRAAGPFSGGKYSVYEGGTRTPLITSWPGTIAPGESAEMVCTIDLASSFAKLTGQTLPADAFHDSLDVLDALLGKPAAGGRDFVLQQNNTGNHLGLRVHEGGRDWKLISIPNGQAQHRFVERKLGSTPVPPLQLFDLQADPAEQQDLADQHPEVVQRLLQRVNSIRSARSTR